MRRNALIGQGQGGTSIINPLDIWQQEYYGPMGSTNPSGDVIVESAAWRDYVFAQRAPERRNIYPPFVQKIGNIVNQGLFPGMGGMGGGGLALNQLLVVVDGIDNPPVMRRVLAKASILDASSCPAAWAGLGHGDQRRTALGGSLLLLNGLGTITGNPILYGMSGRHWIVWRLLAVAGEVLLIYLGVECFRSARKDGTLSMRLPRAKPTGAQIYFIGATNVPVQNLDPAHTRPGRMGRHITYRTPTKDDRKDIFDLYLEKVSHDPTSTTRRRDEDGPHHERLLAGDDRPDHRWRSRTPHHEGSPMFTWKPRGRDDRSSPEPRERQLQRHRRAQWQLH
jgi:hypothetical protein